MWFLVPVFWFLGFLVSWLLSCKEFGLLVLKVSLFLLLKILLGNTFITQIFDLDSQVFLSVLLKT